MSEADIFWRNVKTLRHYKSPSTDFGYELRIGHWVIQGRERDIVLVKQEFKETVSGQIVWGKIKGLGANDMYHIFDMAITVSELMKFPLPKEFSRQRELIESETSD
jgi:hypothetical protein